MSYEFSIARRLFGHRYDQHRVSRPAVQIAMYGVAIGLAVMILAVCIVLGFKAEIRNKVIGFGGHIQVMNYESLVKPESQPIVVDDIMLYRLYRLPGIVHAQRFATKTGMMKTDEAFKGILLRGVAEEYDTTFISQHMLEGRLPRFSATKASGEIAISQQIARELGLKVGSKVFTYFFAEQLKARRFSVVGIYQTHLREFDNNLVFTDLHTCVQLNGWEAGQCSGAELMVEDFDRLDETAFHVAQSVNRSTDHYGAIYTSPTIRELYSNIFAWLSLLDTNVWVILVLMVGISLFTMTSGLLIIILERTNFIAVMKSLGATNGSLQHIFLYFAFFIVGRGLLLGNLLGVGLALLQHHFGLVHLDPQTYYVEAVPVLLSWPLILIINLCTLFITLLVLVLPSYLVSRIHPAQVMRFE